MSNLRVSPNPVEDLAGQLEIAARESVAARGRFSLALSGGSTPRALYELLATPDWKSRFEWEQCDVFFGDERAVAPDDALSNFKMASEALLRHVPARVHRMEGERVDLGSAARDYETRLRALGGPLDVVLLGLGDDGHTASLFPHSPQLNEVEGWVTATPIAPMEPRVRRLTLSFPAINAARKVWFLVSGVGKAERVAEVLDGPRDVERLPSQGVAPQNGELVWFLDEEAARDVSR
ncbi:MAG: 6-phosphogluconolactonase [Armatimonadetes bacterium]|nr:6-phosphogluconolactonase [Armatimonadota bacterium]